MGFGYFMYSHSLVPVIDPWGSGHDTLSCPNIIDWIMFFFCKLSREQFELFVMMLWNVWFNRNKVVHQQIYQHPACLGIFAVSQLEAYH